MDILDDMGVSKLSAKVSLKVNYCFKQSILVKAQYTGSVYNFTLVKPLVVL